MVSRVSASRNGILRLNAQHRTGVNTAVEGSVCKSSEVNGESLGMKRTLGLEFNAALKCPSRKKGRYMPPGHMTKPTAQREIMPHHLLVSQCMAKAPRCGNDSL
jgi:hypothetical protein